MIHRRPFLGSLLAAAAGMQADRSLAQTYPAKPITIVIPYPVGGPADLMARAVGEGLTERFGQPVVVESRPGAGGQVAGQTLLRLPNDGYTLLVADNATLGINKAVFATFNHDPLIDFTPIVPMMLMPMVLYVPKASPFNTVADLIAASRSRALNYASQGNGSLGHLLGEMLKGESRGQFNHIPFQGSAPAMTNLLGGQVDLLFDGVGPGLQHVRSDRLRPLAVAGPRRVPLYPDVPTMAEAGLANVAISLWLGIVARAGTPPSILQQLHDAIAAAMQRPPTSKRFSDLGFQPMTMTMEEFRAFVKAEAERSVVIVRERKIASE